MKYLGSSRRSRRSLPLFLASLSRFSLSLSASLSLPSICPTDPVCYPAICPCSSPCSCSEVRPSFLFKYVLLCLWFIISSLLSFCPFCHMSPCLFKLFFPRSSVRFFSMLYSLFSLSKCLHCSQLVHRCVCTETVHLAVYPCHLCTGKCKIKVQTWRSLPTTQRASQIRIKSCGAPARSG